MTCLAALFASGESILSAWSSIPEPLVAEAMARSGFRAVTIDLQHGQIDVAAAFRLIAAVRLGGGRAVVRVPVGEHQTASRMLDAGADMVIAPMIESVEDAELFGAAMKYQPVGGRSWGPARAVQLSGGLTAEDYRRAANADTLAFAMIETRRALESVDEILALPTIDGLYVGPNDLSLVLSEGAQLDVESPDTLAAIGRVVKRARAAGKPAGIFAGTPAQARRYLAMGFRFVTVSTDLGFLTAAARTALAESAL